MHHLDSWIKRDQLDVTCFIISLFNAQHVSGVNTFILGSLRLICWVTSWVVLLWFDVCWCYVVVIPFQTIFKFSHVEVSFVFLQSYNFCFNVVWWRWVHEVYINSLVNDFSCFKLSSIFLQNISRILFLVAKHITYWYAFPFLCRVETESGGTRKRTGGEVKGKKANGGGSQQSCTVSDTVYPALLPLIRTPRLPAADWTDTPADINGLVRFAERPNLVSARVPSRSVFTLHLVLSPHRTTSKLTDIVSYITWRLVR